MSLGLAVTAVAAIRFLGFGSAILVAQTPAALIILYGSIFIPLFLGLWAIARGITLEPPAVLAAAYSALSSRLARRPATASIIA
jgi:hypothetical protein